VEPYIFQAQGNASGPGTVALRLRSEVGASAVTVYKGSTCTLVN
jgi:hypothetical protein